MDELSRQVIERAEKLMKEKRPAGRPKQDAHAQDDLLPLNSAVLKMMEKSISLSVITEVINGAGIAISKSSIRKFMKQRFPDLYAANYTNRAPVKSGQLAGEEKPRRTITRKKKSSISPTKPVDDAARIAADRMINEAKN